VRISWTRPDGDLDHVMALVDPDSLDDLNGMR
jgi:hypothetical protein